MNNINKIKASPVYQQILADSFGGVLYDVANRDKYDAGAIVQLWDNLTPAEKDAAGGIMKGAFAFLGDK